MGLPAISIQSYFDVAQLLSSTIGVVLWTLSLLRRSWKCNHLYLSSKMMKAAKKAHIYPLGVLLSVLITDGFGRGSTPAADLFGCILHVEASRQA